jgi:uncharacterized protein YndB with AHSA1/START domain
MTRTVDATTRSTETGLEIAAPPEAVWKALTEAPEIVRWFALEAMVEPGTGGSVVWKWADAYRWMTRIELWEPKRRLKLSYEHSGSDDHQELGSGAPSLEGGHELVVDFEIEATAGGTWLRCVHSGFGRDATWDNELEGVRHGWLAELESLRHYLERHEGRDRRAWWAFVRTPRPVIDAWRLLAPRAGGAGLIETGGGGRLRLAVPGLRTELVPLRLDAPRDVVARVPDWNDALLRIWCDAQQDGSMVSLFLSHYGDPVGQESHEARVSLMEAMVAALDVAMEDITVLET